MVMDLLIIIILLLIAEALLKIFVVSKYFSLFLSFTGYVLAVFCAMMIFRSHSIIEGVTWAATWLYICYKSNKLFKSFRKIQTE